MAEKTEQATPKKLADARKKGQVAKSQDIPSAATFIVSIAVILSLFDFILENLGALIVSCFQVAAVKADKELILGKLIEGMVVILTVSVPIVFASTLTGVVTNFLLIGPLFAVEAFRIDFNRFNPIENIKQRFSVKTLVELIKSTLKIFIASYLVYTAVWDQIPAIVQTITAPPMAIALIVKEFFLMIVIRVGIFFVFVSIFDYIYQKMSFAKQMKMQKHEVKQEYKNSEGDPQIKGKRKQIHQEMAYSDAPANVRRAKAVVTNPTHLAVAIAYTPEEGIVAPYVVALGKNFMAELIIKEAKKHDVPIIQNIYLARRLFSETELMEFVPEDTYEIIAEILKWVASLKEDMHDQ